MENDDKSITRIIGEKVEQRLKQDYNTENLVILLPKPKLKEMMYQEPERLPSYPLDDLHLYNVDIVLVNPKFSNTIRVLPKPHTHPDYEGAEFWEKYLNYKIHKEGRLE